jgi:hypothetical protein
MRCQLSIKIKKFVYEEAFKNKNNPYPEIQYLGLILYPKKPSAVLPNLVRQSL